MMNDDARENKMLFNIAMHIIRYHKQIARKKQLMKRRETNDANNIRNHNRIVRAKYERFHT